MRNRYSLAAIVKRTKRKTAIRVRPIIPTSAQERELLAIIARIVRAWAAMVRGSILPVYATSKARLGDRVLVRDDANDPLEAALNAAAGEAERLVITIEPTLRAWTLRFERWHRRSFESAITSALGQPGVGLSPMLGLDDVAAEVEAALARNASLIKGLSDDLQKNVERATWDAFTNQTPRNQLAKELSERLDIAMNRAKFIARDQTIKIGADMNRLRQSQAGIDEYIWRHSGKENFRPEHKARNGDVFAWNKPPTDGHPGTLPNCGCTAQAYVDLGG